MMIVMMLGVAQAEDTYWTLERDPYYHLDAGCDGGTKVEISKEAAETFGKKACPVCVKGFEPIYTGDALPEWPYAFGMWEQPWMVSDEERWGIREQMPEAYLDGDNEVHERLRKIDGEEWDPEMAYPEDYGGRYLNVSGTLTVLLVDPTEESVQRFVERYGKGTWVIAAKYSYGELRQAQDELGEVIEEWIAARPELDVQLVSLGLRAGDSLTIGLCGQDWEIAAKEMQLPVYVRFEYEEMPHAA